MRRLFEGRFDYTGGILGGTSATMGPSVVLAVGSLLVLSATYATYDWTDEQYRCAGLDPAKAKFVGVKNMMNFRYGYGGIVWPFGTCVRSSKSRSLSNCSQRKQSLTSLHA